MTNASSSAGINNVSDTARWVAYYRAMETARPDAVFRDPFAERLAGPEGRNIVDRLKQGRQMAWAMIVRTASIDDLLMQRIRNKQIDLVVNLAAGLDARPWRLDLPASLRWVDVDLPGILDYKLDIMKGEKPRCSYDAIRADLTDPARRSAILTQLGASSSKALVITEGLLIYLEYDDVRGLARDLASARGFRWWITDIAHPRLLKMMAKTWGKAVAAGNAPFKFAPEEGTRFFEPLGWHESEFRSSLVEAKRINREMKGAWLRGLLYRLSPERIKETFKRFAGVVLLEKS
jgi:methyltransferase (TIGR00027 family)